MLPANDRRGKTSWQGHSNVKRLPLPRFVPSSLGLLADYTAASTGPGHSSQAKDGGLFAHGLDIPPSKHHCIG